MCHFFRTYLMMIISPRASYLSPHEFNTEVIIFSIKKFLKKQYMGPQLVKGGKFMLMRDQIFSVAVEVKYQLELFCKDNISNSLCSLYILPTPLGFALFEFIYIPSNQFQPRLFFVSTFVLKILTNILFPLIQPLICFRLYQKTE